MLLDQRFGENPLFEMADSEYWIGRPIEFPGSIPVDFEGSADVATEIATWPSKHILLSVWYFTTQTIWRLSGYRKKSRCFDYLMPAEKMEKNYC